MSTLVGSMPILAFCIMITAMLLGDVISVKTKAYIPSILVCVISLMLLVWIGVIPSNILEVTGFNTSFASYIILMFLVDMGSSVSIQQFIQQWKTVLIGVAAIVGIAATVLTAGAAIFGWEMAAAAAPPLSGGVVAGLEMTNAALATGNDAAAKMASMILMIQNIPGCLLLPFFVKKQCALLQKNGFAGVNGGRLETGEGEKKGFISRIPAKYRTSAFYLVQLALLATISSFIAKAFGGKISPTVFALFLGIICANQGWIERDCMKKSCSSGFLMFATFISVYASLLSTTPSEFLSMLGSVVAMVLIGIVGILILCALVGKILKVSAPMSCAIGVNCLLGFPLNYMLTEEGIKAMAKDEKESEALTADIMPTILIAGFVTVTIGSVIFASVMKNYI